MLLVSGSYFLSCMAPGIWICLLALQQSASPSLFWRAPSRLPQGEQKVLGNLCSWRVSLNYWLACLVQTLPNYPVVWPGQLRSVAWTVSEALSTWEKIPMRTCRPLLECLHFPPHFSRFIPHFSGKTSERTTFTETHVRSASGKFYLNMLMILSVSQLFVK